LREFGEWKKRGKGNKNEFEEVQRRSKSVMKAKPVGRS
jgi:hypothetical protein